jgi:hypothetical protein
VLSGQMANAALRHALRARAVPPLLPPWLDRDSRARESTEGWEAAHGCLTGERI